MDQRQSHKRHLRNYLLDRSFQLKYAGILFAVTASLSLVLGALLWSPSGKLVAQGQAAVSRGQQVVQLGQKVVEESKKVSRVVEMSIVKYPIYADNPELLAVFQSDSKAKAKLLAEQQAELEAQAQALSSQAAAMESGQRATLYTLFALLALLSLAVGFVGIVVTHKVAGPIFKMTRQLHDLRDGSLTVPSPLRKGDELMHFFEAFRETVTSLRERRERELALLDALAEEHGSGLGDEGRRAFDELRDELAAGLQETRG